MQLQQQQPTFVTHLFEALVPLVWKKPPIAQSGKVHHLRKRMRKDVKDCHTAHAEGALRSSLRIGGTAANLVAQRHAYPPCGVVPRAEHAIGQVLQREVAPTVHRDEGVGHCHLCMKVQIIARMHTKATPLCNSCVA